MKRIKRIITAIRNLDASMWIALSAMLISVCALMVSIQEMHIMRSQHRLSMLPFLSVYRNYNNTGFGVQLKNSGSGIGYVQGFKLLKDDREFSNWMDMLRYMLPGDTSIGYHMLRTNDVLGNMIQPGEQITLFEVPWTPKTRQLEQDLRSSKIQLCYASLLNEFWMIENDQRKKLKRPCGEGIDLSEIEQE